MSMISWRGSRMLSTADSRPHTQKRALRRAESEGRTIAELFPGSDAAKEFEKVATHVLSIKKNRSELRESRPLNDEQMGMIAKGERITGEPGADDTEKGTCRVCMRKPLVRKATTENRILSSCATAGAVYGCLSVSDAVTILHGPGAVRTSCPH